MAPTQSFYVRCVPSKFNPGLLTSADAMVLAVKSGFAFTLGLRLFYLFVPLVSPFCAPVDHIPRDLLPACPHVDWL